MDLIHRDKYGNINHILCNDHRPNPAFINEFQTNDFTLKLYSIETIEDVIEGYKVDDGGMFILFHVEIRNNTSEILDVYREDFMISLNQEEPYYPEEYFNAPFQCEDEINIKPWGIYKGCYIFIGTKNIKKMDFFYTEYYDEEHYKEYHLRYKIDKGA